jgi:hypothetical protein
VVALESYGALQFVKGVGGPEMPKIPVPRVLSSPRSPKFEHSEPSPDNKSSGLNPDSTRNAVMQDNTVQRVIASLEKAEVKDAAMKKLLDDARAELLKQSKKISQLETDGHKDGRSSPHEEDLMGRERKSTGGNKGDSIPLTMQLHSLADQKDGSAALLLQHPSERRVLTKKPPPKSGVIRYSELLDYQEFPCIYMEGYLMKSRAPSKLFKRRKSSGFFGNLHRRFFVLQGSFLTYFKSHQYKKPSKDISIDMRGRQVVLLKNHEFGPFAFQINSFNNSCLYLLFASNAHVRDTWVKVLSDAAGQTSPKTD